MLIICMVKYIDKNHRIKTIILKRERKPIIHLKWQIYFMIIFYIHTFYSFCIITSKELVTQCFCNKTTATTDIQYTFTHNKVPNAAHKFGSS